MPSFEFVKSMDDISENILRLESVRRTKIEPHYEFYLGLIKRGKSFVAYPISDGVGFAPTRFLNVKNNNIELHQSILNELNEEGNFTNRIYSIFRVKKNNSAALQQEFENFCSSLGINNREFPPSGYWIFPLNNDSPLLMYLLDDNAQLTNSMKFQYSTKVPNTTISQLVDARVGQGKFRKDLIKHWNGCSHSGCEIEDILRASHIKPWKYSDNRERLCVHNGLLLTPNLDVLFDRGYISFNDNGSLLCCECISNDKLISLGCNFSVKIKFSKSHYKYLDFHRKNIFRKVHKNCKKRH